MSAHHTIDCQLVRDGRIAKIVFANGKGNILTTALLRELHQVFHAQLENKALKLITIEGAGDNFSYGASIQEHAPDAIAEEMRNLRALVLAIAESPVPVASLVRGYCLGGGFELALPAHFIFATDDARFATPEIKLGVFPPVAAALLPRLTTQQLSDRMVIAGEEFGAKELEQAHLVHSVYRAQDFTNAFEKWFEGSLAGYSASSLRHATRASRADLVVGLGARIARLEREYVSELLKTADANEGINAFLAKRTPKWRDR